ncbi:MAG: SDR family oxidoreductase [Candidatus Omnitrophica bacterium]|nr:SDR family oxidoreductase [Candidatus Omnitrophota bacterium]
MLKTDKKIAIVTGSDRGIGFGVCRQLLKRDFKVILTSPDPGKGKAAAEKLKSAKADVQYHVLDVLSEKHISLLRAYVLKEFGRCDVLINNAGVMLDGNRSKIEGILSRKIKQGREKLGFGRARGILEVDIEIVRATLEINTLGPLRMCQAFIPLMIKAGYGRVVNVSSSLGQLNGMTDEDKVPAYQISKTALNAVTLMAADDAKGNNILINSACPGWTRTDIGGPQATQSVEEAAETIIWLATLPDSGPTGGFFRNKRRISW